MADEPQPDIDDELLLDQKHDPDGGDDRGADDDNDPNVNDEGDEEEVLTFGDAGDEEEGDTNLVKHLRNQIRERDKRLAEAQKAPAVEPVEVGPRPTLASCNYDEDVLEQEMDAWTNRKAEADRRKTTATEAGEAEKQMWVDEIGRYNERKKALPYADIDDAEETVKASLDTAQQAVLILAASDNAKVMYALGKNPAKLAELATEKNPVKLAAMIARLEGQLKVTKRRIAPNPDRPEKGSASTGQRSADKQMEKLEKEADRTGDRTALIKARKDAKRAGK